MSKVILKEKETIDEALRRFKRECERAGIMQEIKKREFYEPPSVAKKKRNQELKRKFRRKAQKSQGTLRPKKRV
jgi:small subunit ribosomal protein S21